MKVQPCLSENSTQSRQDLQKRKNYSPNFKAGTGGAVFNIVGSAMQWVQDKGFIASFLIQDGLGMTTPRVGTAYMRDREVTGELNFQEGKEVLLREGITGPLMMAMAPLVLAVSAKFGKSTTINSQLIKRFGNSFKELISKPEFKKELLNDKTTLKKKYIEYNVDSMLKNTLGEGKYKNADVEFIMDQLNKYDNPPANPDVKGLFKRKNYQKARLAEIENYINSMKYTRSAELDMLDKLKVSSATDAARSYETKEALEALMKYSDDIITNNAYLSEYTVEAAENFKDKSIAKRIITTIATVMATIAGMSYIPKIYAKSDISPGARTAMQMKANQDSEKITDSDKTENVSFKGKGGKPNKNWLSKLGKFIREHQNENRSAEFEYSGHNFTNTLFALLSLGGLLLPRGLRAVNRAQVDENGKKDYTELYEILIRDVTSTLSVIFAVPMLTRAFVTSYENKTGFVLMQKDRNQSNGKKFLDLVNPYSKAHVLTNKEIESLYYGVDTKEKMLNFCEYIDKNNGDLQKIFSKSEYSGEIFNEKTLKLSDIENLGKKEKNAKITEMFKKLGNDNAGKEKLNQSIKKMMQASGIEPKNNKLISYAKGLNSMPAAIATFLISPIILGWFIPTITYANSRRIHAKHDRELQKNKINTAA
jgi:hypothetical protein